MVGQIIRDWSARSRQTTTDEGAPVLVDRGPCSDRDTITPAFGQLTGAAATAANGSWTPPELAVE